MNTMILGSGGWGTALALLLLENGHQTTLWSAFPEEAELLRSQRSNPLLYGVELPEQLEITDDISRAGQAELVVLATPSFAVRETARKLSAILRPGTIVVSVAKGIERETTLRLSQVIEQELGSGCPVVVLCGPSHAEEVGHRSPTACVASCADEAAAECVQDAFMNERFRVYVGTDVVGAELGGAMKNVIALCCGICEGWGLGDNAKALLMTRGLTEIARLGVALGGRKETFAGLTGVGDLIVTCTSLHSRNYRAGILIGKGATPEAAVKEIGAVVEGYYAAAAAKELSEKTGVEMPISRAAYQVLYEGGSVEEGIQSLMTRPKRHETEENWINGTK